MCVIAAEMIGIPSNQGIGMFIIDMQSIGRYNSMLAGMMVIGIVGLIIGLGLQKLEGQTPLKGLRTDNGGILTILG